MRTKTPERNKRLKNAMKQNISRRKELVEKTEHYSTPARTDIYDLMQKIEEIKPPTEEKTASPSNPFLKNQLLTLTVISDLVAGGIAGFIIGSSMAKLFGITSVVPTIVCLGFGIMGGFYNIAKKQ